MITIVDYGMGNSGSILNMLAKIGSEAVLTADPEQIRQARKLILPGVGAFDRGMRRLRSLGLVSLLTEKVVHEHTPILGICLGMQLFAKASEEGTCEGLGWVNAQCLRFRFNGELPSRRIPHMGWNAALSQKPHPMLDGQEEDARYYFVHSYHVQCGNPDDVLATTEYGIRFTSALACGAIIGVQFHPEKSLRWGMQMFRRFVEHV